MQQSQCPVERGIIIYLMVSCEIDRRSGWSPQQVATDAEVGGASDKELSLEIQWLPLHQCLILNLKQGSYSVTSYH